MKTKFRVNYIKYAAAAIALTAVLFFTSCYTPSPLYGTWSDNNGNTISFTSEGTFSASILNNSNALLTYMGDYNTIDNVLIFTVNSPSFYSIITEWDIRGAMLYLEWLKADGTTVGLTLYHTAR